MAIVLAQWAFHDRGGDPKDTYVTTTHWETDPAISEPTNLENIRDMLHDFWFEEYNGSGSALAGMLSQRVGQTNATRTWSLRIYNIADATPRVPIFEDDDNEGNFGSSASPSFPDEVACVASYRGEYESGVSRARVRGRFYVGPLRIVAGNDNMLQRPGENLVVPLTEALSDLINSADAAGAWNFVVYSRVGDSTAKVTQGWVDNAWDTQRSRGRRATARTTVPLPPPD